MILSIVNRCKVAKLQRYKGARIFNHEGREGSKVPRTNLKSKVIRGKQSYKGTKGQGFFGHRGHRETDIQVKFRHRWTQRKNTEILRHRFRRFTLIIFYRGGHGERRDF